MMSGYMGGFPAKGEKGDTGATGPTGPQGPAGADGSSTLFENTKSIQLDGTTQWVDFGDIPNFERTNSFTLTGWFEPETIVGTQVLFAKMVSSVGNGIRLVLNGTRIEFFLTNNASTNLIRSVVAGAYPLVANRFFHVAITYDGSSSGSTGVKIYINGESMTPATATSDTLTDTIVNTVPFTIGAYSGGTGFFKGKVDECAIYNTVLSLSDVVDIFHAYGKKSLKTLPKATNLVAYWSMENNVTDSKGTYNGTWHGTPTYSTNTPINVLVDERLYGPIDVNLHPFKGIGLIENFPSSTTGSNNWATQTGGGVLNYNSIIGDRTTVIALSTSTSATAAPAVYLNMGCMFGFNSNSSPKMAWALEMSVSAPAVSTATEEFVCYVGWKGSIGAVATAPAQGIYFLYDRTRSVNWLAICRRDSVETAVDTGVPVTANIYRTMRIEVNADGTRVFFKLSGVIVAEITTDIPTSNVRFAFPAFHLIKTVGTTSRDMRLDWATLKASV